MDKLASMRTFVRIVETGSLTAAAADLSTSLPTVVRTLAALEHRLGVPLLKRTTRRMHLTDEGAQYLKQCRLILSAIHDAEDALVSRRRDLQGKITVTASVQFGRRYVSPFLAKFLGRHPGLMADLLLVNRMVNLVEEGVDVAVRIAHLRDASLVAIPVGQVRRVVCASPAHVERHGVPQMPNDIKRHRCVRHSVLTPRSEWQFRVGQRNVTIPISPVLVSNDIDSALDACISGLGLGMFLSYMVASHVKDGRLVYVLEEFETEPIPVQIAYSSAKLISNNVRVFVDECAQELRHLKFD
ncbi:MAG: LysR family transcriptional regulator [Rhodospirillales bacterium]|nr:LysR family transcriptional regulator [Rhodospirillales bacterium]